MQTTNESSYLCKTLHASSYFSSKINNGLLLILLSISSTSMQTDLLLRAAIIKRTAPAFSQDVMFISILNDSEKWEECIPAPSLDLQHGLTKEYHNIYRTIKLLHQGYYLFGLEPIVHSLELGHTF
jgi:hypothetical protein